MYSDPDIVERALLQKNHNENKTHFLTLHAIDYNFEYPAIRNNLNSKTSNINLISVSKPLSLLGHS